MDDAFLNPLQNQKPVSESLEINQVVIINQVATNSDNVPVKRKGRGKAKKPCPSRSLVSVLIDDSDIKLLNDLATKHDMNFSQLLRAVIKSYLKRTVM